MVKKRDSTTYRRTKLYIYKLVQKFFMAVNQRPCVAVEGVLLAPSSHHLKEELVHCCKTITHLLTTMNFVICVVKQI
ncbi:hypothetical protein VIGAN_02273900, partial [Vigna angularis var. angularis]